MSVVPRRKWRRSCYAQQTFDHPHLGPANVVVAIKAHRRYSSGPVPISPLANKTLGEFVKARKLEVVLETYPADMPLTKVVKIYTIKGYCFQLYLIHVGLNGLINVIATYSFVKYAQILSTLKMKVSAPRL